MIRMLFTRADRHDCQRVRAWMDDQGVVYVLRDIDDPGARPGKRLFIAPALCKGTELVAYGVDFITYLEQAPR